MKYLIILPLVFLLGCAPKVVHVGTECPTFDARLVIDIERVDDTHAKLTWRDANAILQFLARKKVFNLGVEDLNNELAKD